METPSYYAVIPANVRYSNVTANAKLLYGEITALASKTGVCWATNKYFAGLYGTSIRTVQRWLYELHDAGFIALCEAPSGARGMRLPVPFVRDDKNVMPPDNPVTPPHDKSVTQNTTRVNNTEKNPPTPKGEPDGFEEIWKAKWSRGTAPNPRQPALKAYAAALKRGSSPAEILAGVKARVGVDKEDTVYAPQLVTWLNQERWKDGAGNTVMSAADIAATEARLAESRRQFDDEMRKRVEAKSEEMRSTARKEPLTTSAA